MTQRIRIRRFARGQNLQRTIRAEHMRNAGPYARLKFAMGYWCARCGSGRLTRRICFLAEVNSCLICPWFLRGICEYYRFCQGWSAFLCSQQKWNRWQWILSTLTVRIPSNIPRLRKENPRLDLAAELQNRTSSCTGSLNLQICLQSVVGLIWLLVIHLGLNYLEWNPYSLTDTQCLQSKN